MSGLDHHREARDVLLLSTVAQSLALQMPGAWDYLRALGMRLTFASAPDGWEDDLRKWGAFVPIPSSRSPISGATIKAGRQIASLISSRPWAFVQTQTPIASALARLPRRDGIPMLYVAHGFHFHADGGRATNFAYSSIERLLARRVNALAVVSEEDFLTAQRLGIDRSTYLWHLPGAGVDLHDFTPTVKASSHGRLRLIFVGEFNSNKDPLRCIRVAKHLKTIGSVQLTMIGRGPLSCSVASAFHDAALDGEIIPKTHDVARYMREADILLAPSAREGLPRVVIEALASGLAVVAQSNRGTRELLRGGIGELMEPNASDLEWTSAILRMQSNSALARRVARAKEYSIENSVASYAQLLHRAFSLGPHEATRGELT